MRSFALGFEIEVDIHMLICLMAALHKVIAVLCCSSVVHGVVSS